MHAFLLMLSDKICTGLGRITPFKFSTMSFQAGYKKEPCPDNAGTGLMENFILSA